VAPGLGRGLPATGESEFHDARTDRWYFVQTRGLRWPDRREVLLRVLTDITEGKRVSELMQRHREAVHRTSRLVALGEFASAIAHELNQPLAAIATYSSTSLRLLDADPSEDAGSRLAEVRDAMDKCRAQATRAGAIIQRLREFLRQRGPTLAEFDLNMVAREAHRLIGVESLEAGVGIELELAADLPRVVADRVLIEQVVLNLVRNAIEATPRQGPAVRLSTQAAAGGAVTLRVSDSGSGVPAEILPTLFDAFVTTKPGGLGLGLSICRSVIEAHGGTISHAPVEGGGSRFEFTLPRKSR
jgi:signal transduction histidine kinase